ncbi:MAG: IS3 family transposase [Anaerolineae bacterium]|nr:IS3 family transposase [Anaerolineae bacterium]
MGHRCGRHRLARLMRRMGSVGDCYDNAAAKSFFSTLKRECVNRHHFTTRKEAKRTIFEYLEVFYNRQRLLHPGLSKSS